MLRVLAEGASNAEVAGRLVISIHTTKIHVANILAKLGVFSRTAAAARDVGLDARPGWELRDVLVARLVLLPVQDGNDAAPRFVQAICGVRKLILDGLM